VYQDKTLTCIDCGADFTFTADEQEFYASHNLTHDPKRCRPCREKRKLIARGQGRGSGPGPRPDGGRGQGDDQREVRVRYKIICNNCGKEDMVPFKPKEGREVFCRSCYGQRRQ